MCCSCTVCTCCARHAARSRSFERAQRVTVTTKKEKAKSAHFGTDLDKMSLPSSSWLLLGIVLVYASCQVSGAEVTRVNKTRTNERSGKALPIFEFIEFPNEPCLSEDSGINGTCYSSPDCSDKGGTSSGTCASGYGVCCVFKLECGDANNQNNTQLSMSTTGTTLTKNPCIYTICPTDSDVCRIKLDFRTFELVGPSEGTAVAAPTKGTSTRAAAIGDCLTDTFTVSSPGKTAPPVICGYNTGQHMILDTANNPIRCHKLTFTLGPTGTTRKWDIGVTQYSCYNSEDYIGSPGCLQFFTGASGDIASYNFPTTVGVTTTHLSNQHYTMCIRAEQGYCGICYIPYSSPTPTFGLSINAGGTPSSTVTSSADSTACTTDYLNIPGGQKGPDYKVGTAATTFGRFCGRYLSTKNNGGSSISICTNVQPFTVTFVSDEDEISGGTTKISKDEQAGIPGGILGFKLNYVQQSC